MPSAHFPYLKWMQIKHKMRLQLKLLTAAPIDLHLLRTHTGSSYLSCQGPPILV